MKFSATYLISAAMVVGAGLVTACSDAGSGSLPSSPAPTAAYQGQGVGGGQTAAAPAAPAPAATSTTTTTSTQPPPDAGAGSLGSQAHQFFDKTVYPDLAVCVACHANGTDGAPGIMASTADTSYSDLDAAGLIATNSRILTQGSHDGNKAPALTATQQSDLTQWFTLEQQERGSSSTPSVLQKLATCMDPTEFAAIGLQKLRTTPRTGENTNRCSGCDNAVCSACHGDSQTPFYDQIGSALGDDTFQRTQTQPFITMYFGLNGTTPVALNAIANWSTTQAAAPPYSHPMFTIPAAVSTALNTFVTDTINKYNAGTCTGTAPDGGTN